MSARRMLLVAILALVPAGRLSAQYGVPGPVIVLSFLTDPPALPPFNQTCSGQPSAPYSASCTRFSSVGGVMSASAVITPGGPTGSVFTQASFSGDLAKNSFADVESLASLEEEVWFTGGNPADIFSFAVSGFLQFTLFKSAPSFSTFSFVHLFLGTVNGGIHQQCAGTSYGAPDETFNFAIQANPCFSDPPEAFFFRLASESSAVAGLGGSWDVLASALAVPFVTFYDAAGNDITGNYTLSYVPAPDVVPTPEPATFATMLTGLLGIVGFVNRRERASQTLA